MEVLNILNYYNNNYKNKKYPSIFNKNKLNLISSLSKNLFINKNITFIDKASYFVDKLTIISISDYNLIFRYRNFSFKIIIYNKNDKLDVFSLPEFKFLNLFSKDNIPNIPEIIIFGECYYFFEALKKNQIFERNALTYNNLFKLYSNNKIKNSVSFLSTKWYNLRDLKYFFKLKKNLDIWINIIFRIILTLAIIFEKYPSFRHNDLSFKNVLIENDDSDEFIKYQINDKYFKIKNMGIKIYLWDFEFSNIPNVIENHEISDMEKEYGILYSKNQYYDIHYFFNSMYHCKNIEIPLSIKLFIKSIIPNKYFGINSENNYRLLENIEFTTPLKLLDNNLFKQFITTKNDYSKF